MTCKDKRKAAPKTWQKDTCWKKLNISPFPTFLFVCLHCWLLIHAIVELCTERFWSLGRISAVYFCHHRFGQGKQKLLQIFNIAFTYIKEPKNIIFFSLCQVHWFLLEYFWSILKLHYSEKYSCSRIKLTIGWWWCNLANNFLTQLVLGVSNFKVFLAILG